MKIKGLSLAESYQHVQNYRPGIKVKPSLMKKLISLEIRSGLPLSVKLDGTRIIFLNENKKTDLRAPTSSCCGGHDPPKKVNNIGGVYCGMIVVFFFGVLFAALVSITGKI